MKSSFEAGRKLFKQALKDMPGREIPLVTGEIYHVFNRGVAGQPVFYAKRDYVRLMETLHYYLSLTPFPRYSKFLLMNSAERTQALARLVVLKQNKVELLCYCLMPNHFHLLLRQIKDGGLAKYIGDVTNSYTRYVNVKSNRSGPLFQGKFKAVRIESEPQLLHVQRYIHLNSYTGYVVKTVGEVVSYPHSSLGVYLGERNEPFVSKHLILSQFRSLAQFKHFVLDYAHYQRRLHDIKHLMFE